MATTIARPKDSEYAPYYGRYIGTVPDDDFLDALERQGRETVDLLEKIGEGESTYRYAPGKWNIREVVGHVTDTERVFTYRALAFARGETAHLPSFDEQKWAGASSAGTRPLKELIAEFKAVRAATLSLFQSFSEEELVRSGMASDNPVSVRALAFITAGHERHHVNVLREKYLSA